MCLLVHGPLGSCDWDTMVSRIHLGPNVDVAYLAATLAIDHSVAAVTR